MNSKPTNSMQVLGRGTLAALAFATLAACNMNLVAAESADGGIGFRQARMAEVSAMRAYRKCRDDGVTLANQARKEGAASRYLASARMLERCEADLGPEVSGIAVEERMRGYGLSIQNYLKGGDIAAARANLGKFKTTFEGYDLFYADGSSFIESMGVLLSLRPSTTFGEFSIANVSGDLKSELRRSR